MYETVIPKEGHLVCSFCGSQFPRNWVRTGTAVYKGCLPFCSKKCADKYSADHWAERADRSRRNTAEAFQPQVANYWHFLIGIGH